MPRDTSKVSVVSKDVDETDYLEVDKPVTGQNFVCLSFVSPEKVLQDKKDYFYWSYTRQLIARYQKLFEEGFAALLNSEERCDDGVHRINSVAVADLRKSVIKTLAEDNVNWTDFRGKWDDFKYSDEERLGAEFDAMNKFQTSVRGLKVRGVYDTKKEADVRASVLQRQDPSFDVFVGQVGYWLPWDPTSTKIAECEYLNKDLNNLVKEYKANEVKKDIFYQEQKATRQKDALSTAERLRHKLEMKRQQEALAKKSSSALEITNEEATPDTTATPVVSDTTPVVSDATPVVSDATPVVSEIETVAVPDMDCLDPWMQRKMEQ